MMVLDQSRIHSALFQEINTAANVITSYSIHYTKLYDLEGDGGKGLVFIFNFNPLLGLKGLVKTFRVPPAAHKPACKFIYNDDLAVFYNVVCVTLENYMGL